jgi:hypothetical protein
MCFPFRKGIAHLKGKADVDQLMLNLLGPAESSDSGAILLIDSTTATNVQCGGKRSVSQQKRTARRMRATPDALAPWS